MIADGERALAGQLLVVVNGGKGGEQAEEHRIGPGQVLLDAAERDAPATQVAPG
jgi:hypothetical protein